MRTKVLLAALVWLMMLFVLRPLAFAQEKPDFLLIKSNEIQELEYLRLEDPQAFQLLIRQRRAALRDKLEDLKINDPDQFQHIIKQYKDHLSNYIEQERQRDPLQIQQLIQRRRQQEKILLQRIMHQDPDRFNKIIAQRYKSINRQLETIKKSSPDRYQKIITRRAIKHKDQKRALPPNQTLSVKPLEPRTLLVQPELEKLSPPSMLETVPLKPSPLIEIPPPVPVFEPLTVPALTPTDRIPARENNDLQNLRTISDKE